MAAQDTENPAQEPNASPQSRPAAFTKALLPPRMRVGDARRPATSRPALLMAIAYLCGVSVGWSVSASPGWLIFSAAFAFAAAALEVPLGRRARVWFAARRGRAPEISSGRMGMTDMSPYSGALALAGVALVGWAAAARASAADERAAQIANEFRNYDLVRVEGRLIEAPLVGPSGWTLTLGSVALASGAREGPPVEFPTRVLAHIPDDETQELETLARLHAGMRIAVWGRALPPEAPTRPGEMDRVAFMRSRGAGLTARAQSTADIDVLVEPRRLTGEWWRLIDSARLRIDLALGEILDERAAATARALFLGDRKGIGYERVTLYENAGVAHLLSVSGAHVGFVLVLLLPLGRLLRLRSWGLAIFAGAALLVYASLTGMRPPVVRAAVMAEFLLIGLALRRPTGLLSALAASAFASAALDPRNPLRVDWLLSYLCISSIILLQPVLYELIPAPARLEEGSTRWMRLRRWTLARARFWFWGPLAATLATQMGLLPLQSALFGEASLIGFFIQAPALALSGLIVGGAALLGLPAAAAPWAAPALTILAEPLNEISGALDALIGWAGNHPWATTTQRAMPVWAMGLYYGAMLFGPHVARGEARGFRPSGRQKAHSLARALVFFAALVALAPWRPVVAGAPMELYVVDVGQGDCLVLRLPDRRIGLIDGGLARSGPPDREPAVAFLRSLNIARLDFVLATHADADHIGGLPDVIRSFDVDVFYSGPDRADTELYEELDRVLREKGTTRRSVLRGDRIEAGPGCVITALNPVRGQDNNNASVVWLIQCGDVDLLLTGDIEASTEREILSAGLTRDVEVLKVAHHGSATSTLEEFLDAFQPEIALISAGRNNRFGHPRAVVLDRLRERGILTARTDQLGTLLVQSDGKWVRLLKYEP